MIDSTNPRVMADNIKRLSGKAIAQGAELEALGSYSTTEVDTGMKYGDDTIYRKVFIVESLPNNEQLLVPHGVTNLGQVITLRAIATGVGSGFPIDYRNLAYLSFTSTNIILTTVADYSGQKGLIVFEYTKSAVPTPNVAPSPNPNTRALEEPKTENRTHRRKEIIGGK